MRLKPDQLMRHLAQSLAPVYLISGDEPQQLMELADAVRIAGKNAGFEAREIFSGDTGFEWGAFLASACSGSVFSDKKIVDLRLPGASPGADGSKALIRYCESLPEDTLLLVSTGKIASESTKSRWFQALDKAGVVIQVWPLEGQALLDWLQQKMLVRGMQVELDGVKALASRIEGNLPAAVQEIEKLFILFGAGRLSRQQIIDAVSDNSRFDVYKLTDSVLAGNLNRVFKIMSVLQAEGTAAPIVLWALTREARTLIKFRQALEQGRNRDMAYKECQIRDNRKPLIADASNRLPPRDLEKILIQSAKADRQIKGQEQGDPWETLLAICIAFASQRNLVMPDA
ncbi:MAG: DNA polymerase III subunit delta [Gammaproteobacteria bacterium]